MDACPTTPTTPSRYLRVTYITLNPSITRLAYSGGFRKLGAAEGVENGIQFPSPDPSFSSSATERRYAKP